MIAALILPLYDPIRLAEDMVVLDIISSGRVSYILAVGYRPESSSTTASTSPGGAGWSRSSSRCCCGRRPGRRSSTKAEAST